MTDHRRARCTARFKEEHKRAQDSKLDISKN
jgi:hypothetical protein